MKTCDILIRNGRGLKPDMTVAEKQFIAIRDSRIVETGDENLLLERPEQEQYTAETVIDDNCILWMPGLTDAHLHTSQQFLKGSLLDERPVIWKRINVPFEASLTEDTMALSAQLTGVEMIKNGTTSFVDAGGPHVEAAAEEYLKMGMRAALTWQTTDGPRVPDSLRIETKDALPRLERLYKNYHNKNGILQVYYSVTSLMACSEELFRTIFEAAKEDGITAECHMNEYTSEVMDFIEKYGERPFEYLEHAGIMPQNFVAAHCIMLSEPEIEILAHHQVRAVHCPFSNCGKGVPQTPRLLGAGIPVAFGSDGAGHGGLDLFREMRAFRCVMNAVHGIGTANPQIMPAKTLLSMALQGGAKALMEERLGKIEAGCLADIIAIDLAQPHLFATGNVVNSLIESACGSDVKHSVIHGKLVMKNRELLTIDEEKVLYDTGKIMGTHPFFQKESGWCGNQI